MLAVFFLNLTFVFAITGKTYGFFLAYRLMHGFTFKFKIRTTRNRSIDTMRPNKLAVYFVADIDFQCGLYGFLLWPIWFVAPLTDAWGTTSSQAYNCSSAGLTAMRYRSGQWLYTKVCHASPAGNGEPTDTSYSCQQVSGYSGESEVRILYINFGPQQVGLVPQFWAPEPSKSQYELELYSSNATVILCQYNKQTSGKVLQLPHELYC